jgi:hypothetical protein
MPVNIPKIYKLIPVLVMFILAGCKGKEGCTDPYAENFDATAEVENNTCISPRDKFIGIFTVAYVCSSEKPGETLVEIKASPLNLTDLYIYSLNELTSPVRAIVNKAEFVIPFQTQWDGITYQSIQGNGSIVGNNVTIQYRMFQGNNQNSPKNNCVATLFN